MRRSWCIWIGFGLCLAVVFAAMAWISLRSLRLERFEEEVQRQAAVEEKKRLALWRMDSALTPLITQETARPYFAYRSFHPVDRAYNRMFAKLGPEDILVPSPLLTFQSQQILLHFQIGPDGTLTSPQVPEGNHRDLAESGFTTSQAITRSQKLLEQLTKTIRPADLMAALPEPGPVSESGLALVPVQQAANSGKNSTGTNLQMAPNSVDAQQSINDQEYIRRNLAITNANNSVNPKRQGQAKNNTDSFQTVEEGAARAVWMGDKLLLAQRVVVGPSQYIQGCWLDWKTIRQWLLGEVADLLPRADLVPASGRTSDRDYMLAALPARLEPGSVPYQSASTGNPVSMSLAIAWGCLLAGAAAVALVLHGTIRLSDRREAFVSAVTHEMRTPLTTFRLYTDLLANNMIPDAEKRQSYLRRLVDEAARLSHLVENVLAYARLSGPRRGGPVETFDLADLVERSRDRLGSRAQQAQMELVVEADPDQDCPLTASGKASAVEQILMNLVDNACKYAGKADDRRIHLQVACSDGRVLLRVRDHGPGLDKRQLGRLFQPFCRSAHEAAGSAPGVGLGLALSRRLARDMGGDLDLERDYDSGAEFVLSLPKAKQ